jgi:hypothetical protein
MKEHIKIGPILIKDTLPLQHFGKRLRDDQLSLCDEGVLPSFRLRLVATTYGDLYSSRPSQATSVDISDIRESCASSRGLRRRHVVLGGDVGADLAFLGDYGIRYRGAGVCNYSRGR